MVPTQLRKMLTHAGDDVPRSFRTTPLSPLAFVSGRFLLSLSLLLGLLLGAVTACTPPPQENVVVLINGRPITQDEFDFRWAELAEATRSRYEKEGGKRKFLDDLITRELLMQEARKQGIDQYQSIRERTQRYKEQQILDELLKDKIRTKIEVSKEELDAYYAQHARELLGPWKVQISQMLLSNLPAAKDLKKQVEMGGDFAKYAHRYSIDEKSKAKGGDLGPYRKGVVVPDVEAVIPTLRPGMVSEPIKTDQGYYLVMVSPLDKETLQADQATRERLRQELFAEKRRKRLDDVVSELRAGASIRLADASGHVMDDTGPRSSSSIQ
ncbi:MAG: peptidylprolyl isomerase [Nitrospiraceae bacterium]